MPEPSPKHARILLLYSETGGGHRSASEAIVEALRREYEDRVKAEMVDFLKEVVPPPLSYLPSWYPYLVKVPQLWEIGYRISDDSHRASLAVNTAWPYMRRKVHKSLQQHPSDLIVSLHPLANLPFLRAGFRNRVPFITVVTDLVSTHAVWYHPEVDLCFVPTEMAVQRALACGLTPEQVALVGLPVSERYYRPLEDRLATRKRLGWPGDGLVVLLMGGGEGFGPIEACARAIADAEIDLALVVVAGRNKGLKQRLEMQRWNVPVYVYAFVEEMAYFMHAADILVTKAGPGTINEALNAGLPMILHSRLPGQEDGNVDFVVSFGAGIWAPEPHLVVAAIRKWIESPHLRAEASAACRRIAHPDAARCIAKTIGEMLEL